MISLSIVARHLWIKEKYTIALSDVLYYSAILGPVVRKVGKSNCTVDDPIFLLNTYSLDSQYDSFRTLATANSLKYSVTDALTPILILRTQKY